MALIRRRRRDEEPSSSEAPVADPTLVPIGSAPSRRRIRVQGQVIRMRARPTSGQPSLAVTIGDGTGTLTAVWTGRRAIGGITLGRQLQLEGVAVIASGHLELTNPAYTLLP